VNLQQYFSALEGTGTVRIYFIKFNIHDNTLAAFNGTQNKQYRVQQKVRKQQCTLMFILQK
jgi:hypothetical protein